MRPKNDSATSSRRGNDGRRFQPPAGLEDVVESIDVLEPGFRGRWILPNGAYDLVLGVRPDDAESPGELPRFVLHTRLTRPFRISDHQGMSCTAVRLLSGN